MKIWIGALAGLIISGAGSAQEPLLVSSSQTLFAEKPALGSVLPSNSEIWLSMASNISTQMVRQGTRFALMVSRDVMVGNYVVIPRGAAAHGRISYRTGKGAFGKSAKMEFDLTDLEVGDRVIPIAGHYRVEGQGNTGATVGAIALVGVVGAAFVTGHSANAAQGSEWRAYTTQPTPIAVAPEVASVQRTALPSPKAPRSGSGYPQLPASEGRKLPNEDVIEVIL